MSVDRVILICPDSRPGLELLRADRPLALAVFLGKPLLDHALDGLARRGVREVLLLVSAWPEKIRRVVEKGHVWGLSLEVATESAELSPEAAAVKYAGFGAQEILTLDSLPQAPEIPVLAGPAAWHGSRAALLPLLAPAMIGTREISPGVWLGLKAQVEATASLTAPCWIGPAAKISRHARVQGFVEEGSIVDHDAVVEDSTVAPGTWLGAMTLLRESVAMGSHLLNWRTGSATRLTDAFLLAPLAMAKPAPARLGARMAALLMLLLTWPILIPALLRGGPLFRKALAARSPRVTGQAGSPIPYREIASFSSPWRRWPVLWNILCGEFAWTGNPPLTPDEAAGLDGEFELRWLSISPGLFTAPEAEGSRPPWDDTAKAHAALFAARADAGWRRRILVHGLRSLWRRPLSAASPAPAAAPF